MKSRTAPADPVSTDSADSGVSGDEFQTVYRKCWEESEWTKSWPKKDLVYARVFAANTPEMLSKTVLSNALALENAGSVVCSDVNATSLTQVPGSRSYIARVQWSPCTAPSGVQGYDIGYVQAGKNESAVKEWDHAFLRSTQSLEMQLPADTKQVTVFLKATSTAGNSNVVSHTMQMDTQPPAVEYTVGCDSNSKKLKGHIVQKAKARACVTYKSLDADLKSIRYKIGSSPGGQEIQASTLGRSSDSIDISVSALQHDGDAYYVTLQLADNSDNTQIIECEKVVLDASPPIIDRVTTALDPLGDVLLLSSKESDACFQVDVVEAHSVGYNVSVEISDGAKVVDTLTSVNSPKVCLKEDNQLVSGNTYNIVVVATNQAGLASEPKKLRFLLDSSPPTGGYVRIAPVLRSAPHDPNRPVSGEISKEPPAASTGRYQSDTRSLVLWLNPFSAASGMLASEYAVAVVPLDPGKFTVDTDAARADAEKIALEDLPQAKVWI